MNRHKALTLLLAVAGLLLAAVVAAPLLLDRLLLTGWLQRQASQALDREVNIGSVQIRYLPQPSLSARKLRIAADRPGSPDLLNARRVTVVPDFGALLGGRIAVAQLHLEGPLLTLPGRHGRGDDAGPAIDTGQLGALVRRLDRIEIDDARVRRLAADGAPDFTLRIPRLDLRSADWPWHLDLRVVREGWPQTSLSTRVRQAGQAHRWRLTDLRARGGDWNVRGDLAFALDGGDTAGVMSTTPLARLRLTDGELMLRHGTDGATRLRLRPRPVDGPAAGSLRIAIDGEWGGRPLGGALRLGPLAGLLAGSPDNALALQLDSRSVRLTARSTAQRLSAHPASADLQLAYEAATDLAAWLPVTLPALPAGRVSGRLVRDGAWRLDDLRASLGTSRVTGRVRFVPGARPSLGAQLRAARLALDELFAGDDTATDGLPDPTTLAGALDMSLQLDAEALVLVDGRVLDDVSLQAALDDGQLDLQSFAAGLAGGRIHAHGRLDARRRPATGELQTQLDALAITRPWGPAAERPLGRLSGQVRFAATAAGVPADGADYPFGWLGRLRAEANGRLQDDHGTDLQVALHTEDLEDGAQRTRASAEGDWRGIPLRLAFSGDGLRDVRDPDRPFALDLEVEFGVSRIAATGTVTDPLALRGLDLAVHASGPNPQRLYRLLGLPLPSLPPYAIQGQLGFRDGRWVLDGLSGRIGDSDLAGRMSLDMERPVPLLRGDLRSRDLDLDDLGLLIGLAPPLDGDETASPKQRQRARHDAATPEVLPRRRFALERLGGLAARVEYRAAQVRAGDLPLDDLAISLRIDGDRMTFESLDFGIGDGSVRNHLAIDAGAPPLQAVVETELHGVDLHRVLRDLPLAAGSRGIVGGHGKLWLRGLTTAELLASADGGFTLLMTGGALDATLVEQAGLDLGETVLAELFQRPAVAIDCAYADLQFRDGRMQFAQGLVDTTDTLFHLDGAIDFGDERFDLVLHASPKDISAPTWRTPLHVEGPFRAPRIDVDAAGPIARTTAAAGLTALAGPIGALLPLLETGAGGESPYCEGLVERLGEARQAEATP